MRVRDRGPPPLAREPAAPNNIGATPVYIACQKGHIEVVRFLHSKRANLDTPDNDGWVACHAASGEGHIECVRELAWLGANLAVLSPDGRSPAEYATDCDHPEIATFLTEVAEAGGSIMWARAQRLARRWPVVRMLLLSHRQQAVPLGAAVGGEAAMVKLAGALALLSRPAPAAVLPQVLGWRVVKFL